MSRLTASPFHRPSPFDLLPSPPETHSDTRAGLPHMLPHNLAVHDSGISDGPLPGASPDTPSRAKKSSSIPYHSATFREKDRSSQRAGKSLIIVIPPSTLIQEHGQHGHTLSNGPYHRLSQGVVMPLFPSLFGQLTAIAREFNFPSTSGLCLYLHYVEDGFTLTPRITDDSWQALWGHLSEPLRLNEHRPLIGGKVEFDIDLRLARWYASWLSTIHRDISDYPSYSYPATAPSLAHFRRESSLTDSRNFEDELGENAAVHQHSAPIGRHIPRKLSLIERFDVSTARLETKVHPRSVDSPPELAASNSHTLSTIIQEEEPQTARRHLDNRVNSWRANAVVSPIPLAATGQTSLDPSNLPNNLSIDTPVELLASPAEEEMRLEDYAWSVSSIGPQSPLEIPTSSWSPPPSIHLTNRLEGSVLLTPSTCTSFGPLDDEYLSLVSEPISRLPSPDVAHRFYEDCPPTPMTATSWGAPLSYPPSPRCVSPVPSLDIGERCMFTTDSTTSALDDPVERPWVHLWPYTSEQYDHPAKDYTSSSEKPWSHVWPYTTRNDEVSSDPSRARSHQPWSYVWPYNDIYPKESSVSNGLHQSFGYPYIDIYRPVYPHLEIYPTVPGSVRLSMPEVWHKKTNVLVRLSPGYPTFDLYPAVYPYNLHVIYPIVSQTENNNTESPEGYPYFNIYPAIRPPFFAYLSLHLCVPPSQYPDLKIYPEIAASGDLAFSRQTSVLHVERALSQSVHLQQYPVFNIYPAVYPHFDLYPSVALQTQVEFSKHHGWKQGITLNAVYPRFNLYPAVYPYFDIYPAIYMQHDNRRETSHQEATRSLSVTLPPAYPSFNLYPCIYPYFDIYPAPYGGIQAEGNDSYLNSALFSGYPFFNLYPGVYPYLDIYPGPYFSNIFEVSAIAPLTNTRPESQYPFFNLYPITNSHSDLPVPRSQGPSLAPVRKSRFSSRLTHTELHALVMMEKRGSFGHIDPIQALQENGIMPGSKIPAVNKDEEMLHHVRQTSTSSVSRNIHLFPSGDPRRLSLSHKPNGVMLPKIPNKPDILRSSSLRGQANLRFFAERDASRPTSLRESDSKPSFPLPPSKPAPRRRDSLVLQRVKAFDQEAESSTGLSKETLAKFPMPPGAPKAFHPLPSLPTNRGN